jgi:hypothetical protein
MKLSSGACLRRRHGLSTRTDSFTEIAMLRIELKDSDPPIWRAIPPTAVSGRSAAERRRFTNV